MPEIVLAVAEGALAVLPRLAPVNGRERDEEGVRALPGFRQAPDLAVEDATPLDCVSIGRVVPDAGCLREIG